MSSPVNLKKSVSIASIIMMGSVLLSRVMGMVRELVIAGFGGTSAEVSAYVASFMVPELLNHMIAGGFLSITFIPIFQKYFSQGNTDKAWRIFSNVINTGSLFLLACIGVLYIGINPVMHWLQHLKSVAGLSSNPSDSVHFFSLTTRLTCIILPAQLFFYWGGFLMAAQYANNRFLLPALAPLCYNLFIILGGILLGPQIGIEGFAWGVLIGAFLGNFALQLVGVKRLNPHYTLTFDVRDPDLRHYIIITMPFIIGVGMTFSYEFTFRFFGLFLDKSAIASTNYALRLMLILVAVFGQAAAAASYPFLSRLYVENKLAEMNTLLNTVIKKGSLYLIPLSCITGILAVNIVSVIYQRGHFSVLDAERTSSILVLYLVGAFAYSASMVAIRGFYASSNTLFPMIITTAATILFLPVFWLAAKVMGVKGIALVSSVSMIMQYLLIYWLWSKRNNNLDGFLNVLLFQLKVIFISLAGSFPCYIIKITIDHSGRFGTSMYNNLIIGLLAGIPSLIIIFILFGFFKLHNTRGMITSILKKLERIL